MPRVSTQIKGNLPIIFWKEGQKVIAHCPLLDLSTCGDDLDQAQERFGEALQIFLEELVSMGTLEEVLSECGFRHKRNRWSPPLMLGQLQKDFNVSCPV